MSKFLLSALVAFAVWNPAPAQARVELNDLVVGYDRAEGDYVFPLRALRGHGELYLEPIQVRVSDNCRGFITVENRRVWCSPRGDRSRKFSFARFTTAAAESDSSWVAHFLEYDRSRVTLRAVADPLRQVFVQHLDIREN